MGEQKREDEVVTKTKELAGAAAQKVKDFRNSSPELKSIRTATWGGLGIGVLFLILLCTSLAVRWWLMLPLGGAGLIIFWKQRTTASDKRGTEAMVCLVGFALLALLLLLRDMYLSHKMTEMYTGLSTLKDMFNR